MNPHPQISVFDPRIKIMEECSEAIKEASKCIAYGPHAIHGMRTNISRLTSEIGDILAWAEQMGISESDLLLAKQEKLEFLRKEGII